MKNIIFVLICFVGFISCDKNVDLGKSCNYEEMPLGISSQANTIIPLHSQNFWVYSDSLFNDGVFESEKSTLLKIEEVYDLDGLESVRFSSLIPQLTVRNDTLFSTALTPQPDAPNCYELISPMFFSTTDSIQVGDGFSNAFVYSSAEEVITPSGIYTDNIIYKSGDAYEVIVNPEIGIIQISFFLFGENNQRIKRRILSLKDYDLY